MRYLVASLFLTIGLFGQNATSLISDTSLPTDPVTCTAAQRYFNTATNKARICGPDNTWSNMGTGVPGGSSGQYQINTAGSFAGITFSGDATADSSGVFTVTKTGGVVFSPSATTNALNATNITSGTLANARTTGSAVNVFNTLVLRDGSGNFAGTNITGNLIGNASGTAATITGQVAAANLSALTNSQDLLMLNAGVLARVPIVSNGSCLGATGGAWATLSCGGGSAGVLPSSPNSTITIGGTDLTSWTVDVSTPALNILYSQLAVSNTFTSGAKQIFVPSATTAGARVATGSLPSVPAAGDLAISAGGVFTHFDGVVDQAHVTVAGGANSLPSASTIGRILVWSTTGFAVTDIAAPASNQCIVSAQTGATFDAQLAVCLASSSTYIDGRNYKTTQTLAGAINNTVAGQTIELPAVTIQCATGTSTDCFKNTASNVTFRGQGKGVTIIKLNAGGTSQKAFNQTNAAGLGTKYNLVTNATEGTNSFTISSGDFTSLAPVAGDYLWVGDQTGTVRAQIVRVLSASTPTITIDGEFGYSMYVVAGSQVARLTNAPSSVTLENLTIDCNGQTTPYGIRWDFTTLSTLRNVQIKNCPQGGLYSNYGYGNVYENVEVLNSGNATGAAYFLVYQTEPHETNIHVESDGASNSFNANHYQNHFGVFNNITVDGGNTQGRGWKLLSSTHNSTSNLFIGNAGNATTGIGLKMEHSVMHNSFSNVQILGTTLQSILMSEGGLYNTFSNMHVQYGTNNDYQESIDFTRSLQLTASYTLTNVGSGVFTIAGAANFANNGGPPNDCDFGNCVGMVLTTSGFVNGANNTSCLITAISSDGKTLTCNDQTGTTTFTTETHSAQVQATALATGNSFSNSYFGDSRGGGSAFVLAGNDDKIVNVQIHEDNLGTPLGNGIQWGAAALGNQRTNITDLKVSGITAGHDIFFNNGVTLTRITNADLPDDVTFSGAGVKNKFIGQNTGLTKPTCAANTNGSFYYTFANIDLAQFCEQTSAGVYAWTP